MPRPPLPQARWLSCCPLPHCAAADVYAYGIVLWEILALELPFARGNQGPWQLVGFVTHGGRPPIPALEQLPLQTPDAASYQAYVSLMQRCWAQDPAARPDFSAVVAELKWVPQACRERSRVRLGSVRLCRAGHGGNGGTTRWPPEPCAVLHLLAQGHAGTGWQPGRFWHPPAWAAAEWQLSGQ